VPPSQCVQGGRDRQARCYRPIDLQRAYGLDELHRAGITGKGTTVAVVLPAASPWIQQDMNTFSDTFGLPRVEVEIINRAAGPYPAGEDNTVLAMEAAMDLQMIHAAAPEAHLIWVQTPLTADWIKEAADAAGWLARTRNVDVVNFSYGVYEAQWAPGERARVLRQWRAGLLDASRAGTTLVASSGDHGPTGPTGQGNTTHRQRTVIWPASDPKVVGVGATRLHLDDHGRRTAPDTLWTDSGGYASGAGTSTAFPGHGSVDLTLVGDTRSRVWFHSHYNLMEDQEPGWLRGAGTSAASPLFAGIVALAAQKAGRPLGDIGPALARIRPGTHGTTDITTGCNHANKVTGYCAGPGRDTASGLGTVHNASDLVTALAQR
jgi:subtilase family serine protease